VTRNGKASLEDSWKSHLPSLKVHSINIDMTEGRRGGDSCLEVDAVACQPLCHIIEETLSSAKETLRQKMGTFHRKFDEMCELVLEGVRDSQNRNDQKYMEKTMESFHAQVGSCSASKADDESKEEFEDKISECNNFYLPNQKFLESAFAPKREICNDFEEQPCKKFLQEVILGQIIQQSVKFASEAYTAFVEQNIEKAMTFFMDSSQRTQVEPGSKLLENYMECYESDLGRKFDKMQDDMQKAKRSQVQEARTVFLETACSSVEDFEDFRTTRRIISKDAYVSMYVGIVVIEATPLLEAMMIPLIKDGADKYQRMIDDALHFYSHPAIMPNITSGGQRTTKDIQGANDELGKMVEQLREQVNNLQKDLKNKERANTVDTELHGQVRALEKVLKKKDEENFDLEHMEKQLCEQVDHLQKDLQQKDDELNSLRSRPTAAPVASGPSWAFQENTHWIPYEAPQNAEIEAAFQQGHGHVTIQLPSGSSYKLTFPEGREERWVQVNLTSHFPRRIKRNVNC